MKWLLIAIVVVLALFGALYLVPQPVGNGTATSTPGTAFKTYENAEYGIAFNYPDTYTLVEHAGSAAGGSLHHIVIADTEALAQAPQNGEGPTAITFDIYSHTATSTEAWIRSTPQSNFQLSPNGALTRVQVKGAEGYTYVWDGLYTGASVVFQHKSRIVMASVTTMSPTDPIATDFARILDSLELQ
jgi:hypothetical protein